MARQNGVMWLVQGISAAVGVSAIAVGASALLQERSSWVMFAFEVVVLVSSVLGFFIGRGRYAQGASLGLLSVAGAVLIGTAFGYLGGGRVLFGVDLKPLVGVRALAAAALVASSAWLVLSRDPKTALPFFVKGCVLGAAMLGLLAVLWKTQGRIDAMGDVGQLGIGMVAFALITGLLAATVHMLVRAFESGMRRADAK